MELQVDTKIIIAMATGIVSCYVAMRVMLAKLETKMEYLEDQVDGHGTWKDSIAEVLKEMSVVLGRMDVKIENLEGHSKEMRKSYIKEREGG